MLDVLSNHQTTQEIHRFTMTQSSTLTNSSNFSKSKNLLNSYSQQLLSGIIMAIAYFCYTNIDLALTILIHKHIKSPNSYYLSTIFNGITQLGESHHYLIIATITYVMYHKKHPQTAAHAKSIFIIIASTGCFVNLMKIFFGRYRPTVYFSKGQFGFSCNWIEYSARYLSFPSGHAVTIFSLAFYLSRIYPKYRLHFYSLATLVASSRLIVTAHYMSDVIVGAWLGVTLSALIIQKIQKGNKQC